MEQRRVSVFASNKNGKRGRRKIRTTLFASSKFLEANWFLIKYQIHEIVEQIEDWTLCRQLEHCVKWSMTGARRRQRHGDIFPLNDAFSHYAVQALSARLASRAPHTRRRNRDKPDTTYVEVKLVAVWRRHTLHRQHAMLWQISMPRKV